jgi:hypothetical protein
MKRIALMPVCLFIILAGYEYDVSISYGQSGIEGFDGAFFKSLEESSSIPGYGQATEEKIYEALFSDLFKEIRKPVFYLANTTEDRWFAENPYREKEWKEWLKDLGDISIKLVQELYSVNRTHSTVDWNPTILDPLFLPEEYSLNSNHRNRDKLCLVEKGKGNVSVYTQTGQQYRSYYTVSKVAFSNDRRYAILKYSKHCSPSGGGEFFVSFEFKDNKWQRIGYKQL